MQALEQHLQAQIEHSRDFFWHRVRWSLVARFLPKNKPFQLLDLGAGAGLFGDFLKRRFPSGEYFFSELLPSLRKHLATTFGADRDLTDAGNYDQVQFITVLDVLEHQENDREFLERLLDKTKPGTKIILTVPAFQTFWSTWDEALGHFRRYDRGMLRTALAGLPVDVEETSYFFPELVPSAVARKITRTFSKKEQAKPEDAEFARLPSAVNNLMTSVGQLTTGIRKCLPVGTSMVAVFTKR